MATRRELKIYGDLVNHHKPTIRKILWQMLIQYFTKKNRYRQDPNIDGISIEHIVNQEKELPKMVQFAIINDGVVEEIIVVNDQISELFRNKKTKIVEFDYRVQPVTRGTRFVERKFVFESEEKRVVNNEKD